MKSHPLWENAACGLSDLGEGLILAEFLGPEIREAHFDALSFALERASQGLLLSCSGPDFSLGASLETLAGNIEKAEWAELDRRGRWFQQVNLRLRRSSVPVVAALRGYVLGAGCEIALHCHSLVAAPDTRMGLVETRAGLLPAAGGTQEMARRARTAAELMRFFSLLARGRLAADAREGLALGYLDASRDQVCEDPAQLLPQAHEKLRQMGSQHQPCQDNEVEVLCSFSELCSCVQEWGLNAYDGELARTIAGVLCAGQLPGSRVSLERLLDLERQAFRGLASQPRTQARIRHLRKAGLVAERRERSS